MIRPEASFNPAIQGLRGFAALTVVVVHLYVMPYFAGFVPPDFPWWLDRTLVSGGRGVELFFMISGYLIPASLIRHRHLSKFFYDRVMRIMPVFVVLHLALFTVGPLAGYKIFHGLDAGAYMRLFVTNFLFVPDLFGLPTAQQNAWTLSYEWAFYLWFAAAYVLGRTSRAATIVFALLGLAAVAIWPRSAFFGIGMAMASGRFGLDIRGKAGLGLGLVLIAVMYGLLQYSSAYAALIPGAAIFAMVISPRSGLAQWLASRPFQFVGRISYSLYLVHSFVLFALAAVASRIVAHGYSPWLVLAAFAVVGLASSLLAATVSFELIEVRLRLWLDALVRGRQPSLSAVPLVDDPSRRADRDAPGLHVG